MSIPVSIDPMGTLGRRPFPMVRLTSNTTGSTLDGGPLPEGFRVDSYSTEYEPWKVFDGNLTARACRLYRTIDFFELDFGCEVELIKLHIYGYYYNGQNTFDILYEKENEWIKSGFVYEISKINESVWDDVPINGIKAKRWRIVPQRNAGNQSFVYEIEYTAFYA